MFFLSLEKSAVKDTAMKVRKSIVKKTPPKNQGAERDGSTGTVILVADIAVSSTTCFQHVMGAIVKFFVGALPDQPISLATGGMHLPNGLRLFAKYDMCFQDGAARKYVWSCKGDSGTKLCMLCRNLVFKSDGIQKKQAACCGQGDNHRTMAGFVA